MTQIPHSKLVSQLLSSQPADSRADTAISSLPDQAVTDIAKLFTHFGDPSAVFSYQELQADSAAQAAAGRWPLMAEWMAQISLQKRRDV